jgi:hypothetical protein
MLQYYKSIKGLAHWLEQSTHDLTVFENTLRHTRRCALPVSLVAFLNPVELTIKINYHILQPEFLEELERTVFYSLGEIKSVH